MNRRNFLKLGSLFVPAAVVPTVAYSFLWGKETPRLDVRWKFRPAIDAGRIGDCVNMQIDWDGGRARIEWNGKVQNVPADVGKMITDSLEKSLASPYIDARRFEPWLKHIVIKGTVST